MSGTRGLTTRRGRSDPWGAVGSVGSLLVFALALVVCASVVSAAFGWRPLSTQWGSVLIAVVVIALVTALARQMRSESIDGDKPPHGFWLQAVVAIPAVVIVAYALAAFALPTAQRVEWFLSGDHVRHLVLVADERAFGSLSYEVRPYPRGWHSGVALIWAATGATAGQVGLMSLISVMATMVWLLSGALALATAALAASLAHRIGVRPVVAAAGGALAGCATLWPPFFGNYQGLGLQSSLVAALILAVCIREILMRPETLSAFIVCSSGLLLMSHTWQLLLPVSGLIVLVTAWSYWRSGGGTRTVVVLLVGVLVALVSLPALTAVVQDVGVDHASDAGVVAPVPLVTLACTLVASGWLVWWGRGDRTVLLAIGLMLIPAATGVWLAFRVGVDVMTYYPGKLLWHTAVLGLACIAAVMGRVWCGLEARGSLGSMVGRTALLLAAAVCAVGAAWAPAPALRGAWSTVDGATVLSLVQAEGAERAVVVWSDGPLVTDTVTRIVLDALKAESTRSDTPQGPLSVSEECALLMRSPEVVILSTFPTDEARARYSCVPAAVILRP